MRLVKVNAPQGKGADVAQIAFSVGIEQASIFQVESHRADGAMQTKDTVDVETSTPKAKRYVDALLEADFYNSTDYSIQIRQPRSIISGESFRELTKPLVQPATDIFEELWQFSHITVGFVGRVFIAACLLAYGLIEQITLLIIAGLLFLPLLPLLLGMGFGAWTSKWKLTGQSLLAFLTATVLLILGGMAIAAVSHPPIKYDEFNPPLVAFLISLAVGIAAGLADSDDVGTRQMIGLAATAQLAIIPVWFGICFVLGFPSTVTQNEITARAATFFINMLTVIVVSLAIYILLGTASRSLAKTNDK
ncbi:MAG: hypothetical protein ACR2MG_10915 [Pyrinomonadaceae bacterium]